MQTPTQDCQPESQRDNRRLNCAMSVRFSVNGGPEQASTTINLTERSLAIKAETDVQKGDLVTVRVDLLPAIEGEVIRVWDDGFAITLVGGSCALLALAHSRNAHQGRDEGRQITAPAAARRRVASAIVLLAGDEEMWCRIASSHSGADAAWAHKITIFKPDTANVEAVRSVWLSIGDARWIARIQSARARRNAIFIATTINGWQLQMAANHGLSISVVLNDLTEWRATASAAYISDHLDQVSSSDIARHGASKTGQPRRQAS